MLVETFAVLLLSGAAPDSVPLYEDLGNHHHPITTSSTLAQQYFDQGLRLAYAFDHDKAVASFEQATRLDPECAMCWWGVAYASGPNINLPMDSVAGERAYFAIRRALAWAGHASPREQAYVRAMAKRYGPGPLENRAQRDSAFARAMGEVARAYPEDDDALTILAESLMDLSPWTYWTKDGRPLAGTEDLVGALETVTTRNHEHAGACHLYIHAVEAAHPERAEPCADRLAGLMPGAGHIVHMPGHIYIRVGRWADAIEANRHAIHADDEDVGDRNPNSVYSLGYMPHNHHFLHFAAMMSANRDLAISTAWDLAKKVDPQMMAGMGFLQHYAQAPDLSHLRFEEWDAVLLSPAPASGLPYPTGIWRFARGVAFARQGDVTSARAELNELLMVKADPSLESLAILSFNTGARILEILTATLQGEIASAEGDVDATEKYLRRAVALEENLIYIEPPEIEIPPRQHLGFALLRGLRPEKAEQVFREDLDRFPENVWSLEGLATALERQGRAEEAADVRLRARNARTSSAGHHHGH